MRKAGRLAADMLDRLAPHVVPGARTDDLDAIVYQMAQEAGGVPASLGYCGFAHSCCISINQVVCHGIPSERTLRDGDIVNIDVTRSEEHTSELQSLMRISYAVLCLNKNNTNARKPTIHHS